MRGQWSFGLTLSNPYDSFLLLDSSRLDVLFVVFKIDFEIKMNILAKKMAEKCGGMSSTVPCSYAVTA